jgi:hypothetical protein
MVVTMNTTADHGRLSIRVPPRGCAIPWKVRRGQPWCAVVVSIREWVRLL